MPYMGFLKQNTAVNKTILMIDSGDHVTGKTGLTITKYVTKAAGTPGATTITTTELDSTNVKGVYKLAFADSDVDTLGDFQLHLTASGADPADYWWTVTTYLPGEAATLQADQAVNTTKFGGTSVTARDIGASVLLSSGTGTGQLDFTSGVVKANLTQILGTVLTETAGQIAAAFKKFFDKSSPTGTINSLPDAVPGAAGGLLIDDVWTDARAAKLDNLDATVSSRLASASYTAPDNTSITAIKAKTDNLPSDPADASDIAASFTTVNTKLDTIDGIVDDILIDTGTDIPASIDALPTANENADALLKRDWNSIAGEASRSVLNALRFIRNKFSTTDNPGFVTVYKEDDTTEAYQKSITTDPSAEPIVEG